MFQTANQKHQNDSFNKTEPGFAVRQNTLHDYSGPLCLFASYSFLEQVDDYVFYYLERVRQAGFAIAFITTTSLNKECAEKIAAQCALVIERENKGLDFGSWRCALELLQWGRPFEALLLANDSVFGPMQDLGQLASAMNKRFDLWGMTDSYESGYHLQSYFLHINKKVISSEVWLTFWKEMDTGLPKSQIIQQYEIGLSEKILNAKFKLGAYAPIDLIVKAVDEPSLNVNASLAYWQVLIEKFNFPFLKREILINPSLKKLYWDSMSLYINQNSWSKTIRTTDYPIKLIDSFLDNYFSLWQTRNRKVKVRKSKILFLAHNMDIGGAQKVLYNFLKWFKEHTDTPFEVLTMFVGLNEEMLDLYTDLCPVTRFSTIPGNERQALKDRLAAQYIGLIFSNTIVNVELQRFLSFLKVPQVVFVHELSYVITQFPQIEQNREWLRENVTKFVACSKAVRNNIADYLEIPKTKTELLYGFIEDSYKLVPAIKLRALADELQIPPNAFVIGMSGTIEWRKSAELVPVLAGMLCRDNRDIHIIWVGADNRSTIYKNIRTDLERAGLVNQVHFVTTQKDPYPFYQLFDIFLMLSREDPFPLVNIESGMMGTPVICFDQSGGSTEYVGFGLGVSVPYMDFIRLKEVIQGYYAERHKITSEKPALRKIVNSLFTTNVQAPKLLEMIASNFDKEIRIPVIQPNIVVMTHLFYDDTWPDIKTKLEQFDNGASFFLFSISEDCLIKDKIVEDIHLSFGNSFALTTSNLGKDIGGKFALIDLYLTLGLESEFIVFLHDKQSPQTLVGEAWKNNLHKIIDKKYYRRIVDLFTLHPHIGIVGAKEHIINEFDPVTGLFRYNHEIVTQFLKKYDIQTTRYEYLSGTMYWLRSSIIELFFSKHDPIALREELESGNVLDNYGSTVAHTWERMFCWISANQGFEIYGI